MRGHIVLRGKRGQATQGSGAGTGNGLVKALAIRRQLRAIIPWMPKVKNAGGESTVFAARAGAHQTYRQIRILKTPADEAIVEAIDAIEIAPCDCEVAGLGAAPTRFLQLAQRSKRQIHRREQAIDAAAQALARKSAERPRLRRQSLRQDGRGEFARQQDAIADHEPAWL